MDQLLVLLALLLCGLLAVLRRGRAPPPPSPPSLAMHKIVDPVVAHRALVENADAFSNRPPAAPARGPGLPARRPAEREPQLRGARPALARPPVQPHRRDPPPVAPRRPRAPAAEGHPGPRRLPVVRPPGKPGGGDGGAPPPLWRRVLGRRAPVLRRRCRRGPRARHAPCHTALPARHWAGQALHGHGLRDGEARGVEAAAQALRHRCPAQGAVPPSHRGTAAGVQSPRPRDDDGRRPYADSLVDLRVPDEDGGRRALRDDEMVQLISEFLGAGTGTVVASLEWALAHLVDKPEVQEKLRGEVDDGEVSRAGAGMPYLHAIVLETLRMHPPLPVIPRHVHADAVGVLVGGMAVPPPAGDFYVNFSAGDIGRDSKIWTDPDEFRPERFLPGGDGEGVGPLPGPKQIRMMPFGAGHRFCPGVGMAMVNMKCFLAALVREFEWAPPTGTNTVDLTELDSFFKVMKKPLSARVTRRTKSI